MKDFFFKAKFNSDVYVAKYLYEISGIYEYYIRNIY